MLQGFSLHADTMVQGNDRQGLERLCRYGARGPVAESRLRRLVALVPPPRRHLTSFHGVYAPHAALRPVVTQPVESPPAQVATAPTVKKRKRHLDWATLHERTWGTDVLRCPCGGRRSIRSLHSTRKQAEARLLELGVESVIPLEYRTPRAPCPSAMPPSLRRHAARSLARTRRATRANSVKGTPG